MAISDVEPFGGDFQAYRWVAAQSLPSHEFAAARILRRAGFAALVPAQSKPVRLHRFANATKPVSYPVITGYVLVGVPLGHFWREVEEAGLIRGVVSRMIGPERVPYWVVIKELAALVSVYGDGSDARVLAPSTVSGMMADVVSITDAMVGRMLEVHGTKGGFDGHVVELSAIEGDQGRVLAKLFGVDIDFLVPLDNLRA